MRRTNPGGPKKRTPAGTSRPNARNLSGWAIGSSTLCKRSYLTSARAPTSPESVAFKYRNCEDSVIEEDESRLGQIRVIGRQRS